MYIIYRVYDEIQYYFRPKYPLNPLQNFSQIEVTCNRQFYLYCENFRLSKK